ncbi:hypothetical protein BTVI_150423 [Pitangus sulphuratus]|nr:hypothetical protein BTVI_150423 [Pitangus sulphuratus]
MMLFLLWPTSLSGNKQDLEYNCRQLISEQEAFWSMRLGHSDQEMTDDWKIANITLFKKGKKENLGNYGLVSFTFILGKTAQQLILETISGMNEKTVIRINQHRWMKGKSGLISMIAFCTEMRGPVEEGRECSKLFILLISDLDEGRENLDLSTFADDTNLERLAVMLEYRVVLPFGKTWTGWRIGQRGKIRTEVPKNEGFKCRIWLVPATEIEWGSWHDILVFFKLCGPKGKMRMWEQVELWEHKGAFPRDAVVKVEHVQTEK